MVSQRGTLTYLHSTLNLIIDEDINVESVLNFFTSHFLFSAGGWEQQALATIHFTKDEKVSSNIHFDTGETLWVRKSASDFFSIPALRLVHGTLEYVRCVKSGTTMIFDQQDKTITVSNGHGDMTLDAIELIRDIVLKHEENCGMLILHAACAYKEGVATVITGPKGAGKSTLLLNLINSFQYQLMSGDKTLIFMQDGHITAAGWPDYPHLGLGTIGNYPHIHHLLEDIDLSGDPDQKIALDPIHFRDLFPITEPGLTCPLAHILYPAIREPGASRSKSLSERREGVERNRETAFSASSFWHHYIDKDNSEQQRQEEIIQQLESLDAYQITGLNLLSDPLPQRK